MKRTIEIVLSMGAALAIGHFVKSGEYGTAAFLFTGFTFSYLQEIAENLRD